MTFNLKTLFERERNVVDASSQHSEAPACPRPRKGMWIGIGILAISFLLLATACADDNKESGDDDIPKYICTNGTVKTGAPTGNTDEKYCESCDDGYKLSADDSCIAIKYTCTNGTVKTGAPTGNINVEFCTACKIGYKLSTTNSCVATKYTCANGTSKTGTPGGSIDVEFCSNCDIGYYVTPGGPCKMAINGTQGVDWNLKGTPDNDRINGLAGDDRIYGYGGEDIIDGGGGSDRIYGGDDNDTIDGGSGSDFIRGEGGDDLLLGGIANDTIYGGEGNDVLDGGEDPDGDFLHGGPGADIYTGGLGNDEFVLEPTDRAQDVVTDFSMVDVGRTNNKDKLRLIKRTAATDLPALKAEFHIRFDNGSNYDTGTTSNDVGINDTVIYYTHNTLSTDDDEVIMVLEDHTTALTFNAFRIRAPTR